MTSLNRERKHMGSRFTISRNETWAILRGLRNVLTLLCIVLAVGSALAQTPAVGAKAPDFTLDTPTGNSVSLATERAKGTTALVLLRGFPGYQCPYCVKQVHDFVEHSADFAAKKVNVLFVYPVPPADLDQPANEFLAKQSDLPPNIKLVIDPDYKMTNLYVLPWNPPHSPANPSTFILDTNDNTLSNNLNKSNSP